MVAFSIGNALRDLILRGSVETGAIRNDKKHHCWRNATVGSMRVARRAGM